MPAPGGKKLALVRAKLDQPKPPKRRHKPHKPHQRVTAQELSLVRGWLGAGMTLPAAAAVLGRSVKALKYHLEKL